VGRALILVSAAALTGLAACSGSSTHAVPLSRIELTDCSTQYFGNARCGTHEVWENRTARTGRRIPLHIVVLPARGSERHSDPVFYFDGGPGAAATQAAAAISRLLGAVNQARDLVFVDVRGTGRSGPLACGLPPDDAPLQRYFDAFLSDDYVRGCLERQQADRRPAARPRIPTSQVTGSARSATSTTGRSRPRFATPAPAVTNACASPAVCSPTG
jgi:hypothetical protein